jgi:ABC-type nitrate/sulfonate/bicarbonate transport system permease component
MKSAASILRGIGGFVVFLLLWEAAVRGGLLRFDYLPAPSVIAAALIELAVAGDAFGEIAHTLGAALAAWAISVTAGTVFGAVLGLSAKVRTYSMATVELVRPLPPVALVPVALLLFGFSIKTELVVAAIPAAFPVLIGTMGGVMAVPSGLRDVGRSMRLGRAETVWKIVLPAAAPSVLVGCRLGMSISLVLAIVVEMIGNPEGLGYAIVREAQALNSANMFAYIFIVGALGVLLNAALVGISMVFLPGRFGRIAAASADA